ncbi:MAG: 6-phosphogluconolactonase [Spirochaetes bacterium RBG_13_68_11]|nr:MAG: 6-phosphogluconolactonase [Spirochaetes bacterium RBG_13_68_11]
MTLTRVFADTDDLADRAAEIFADAIGVALRERGRTVVVLAGGTTPRAAYDRLAARLRNGGSPLDGVYWLPCDERWAPVDHPDSNEGMIRQVLLGPVGAPERTILSWQPASGDPADCAARFAERLAAEPFAAGPDLAILGIGADGHTASLFPGAVALLHDGREVPVDPDLPADAAAVLLKGRRGSPLALGIRLTLTAKWLRMARCVAFLAAGSGKREALARTLRGDCTAPAAWVRGAADTLFLVDRAAAGPGPDATGRDVRYA